LKNKEFAILGAVAHESKRKMRQSGLMQQRLFADETRESEEPQWKKNEDASNRWNAAK